MTAPKPEAWAEKLAKNGIMTAECAALACKSKAGLTALAASPDGRARLLQMRANFNACQAPLQSAGKELQGAVAAIDKALGKRRFRFRA